MLEDLDLHTPSYKSVQYIPANNLPANGSLKDLNLDSELYATYAGAKNFLANLEDSEDGTPANQVAQVYNTITSILKEITKMQTDLYNAERVKKLEAAIISALKLAPQDVQEAFFEQYVKLLKE